MVLKGNLWSGLARALDVAHGLDRLVGQGELAAPVKDVPAEIIGITLPNVVDEVASVGVLKGHEFARDHHFQCLGLADEAGQASGATGSCKHTEVDFWKTDLPGVFAGDADVGGHGNLQATTNGVSVDGANDKFSGLLEPRQGFVGVKAKVVLETGADAVEHLDGGARREKRGTVAGQDDAGDAVVEASADDGLVNVSHHAVRVGVGRAVVGAFKGCASRIGREFNHGNSVLGHAVVDESVWHGFKFQSVEVAHALSQRDWHYEEIAEISCASPSALLVKDTWPPPRRTASQRALTSRAASLCSHVSRPLAGRNGSRNGRVGPSIRLSMNGEVSANTIRLNKLGRNNFPIHRNPSPLLD